MNSVASIGEVAQSLLGDLADPSLAVSMAAYMKTDMPFYGVAAPDRRAISRALRSEFPSVTRLEYENAVRTLWCGEHREEKYLAVGYARAFPMYVTLPSVRIYRTMITQGAWWDFVDEIASHLIGTVLSVQREDLSPTIEGWATSGDMWLRRTSIICQLRHKADTDTALLATVCTANLGDTEFFIRKAIGWALREYAKTDPGWVLDYVSVHGGEMSALTRREATKHLR